MDAPSSAEQDGAPSHKEVEDSVGAHTRGLFGVPSTEACATHESARRAACGAVACTVAPTRTLDSVREVLVREGVTLRLATGTADGMRTRAGVGGDTSGELVWDAAHLLNAFLLAHPSLVRGGGVGPPPHHQEGRRVLELGAGQGLCGLLAAAVGAQEVVVSDSVSEVVHTLEATAALTPPPGRVRALLLDWEVETTLEAPPAPEDTFPVVLSSDVVYAEKHADLVAAVVARRLARTRDARAYMVMGIRGVMWQMMDHGSPVYLLEKLISEMRRYGLGVAAAPLESTPGAAGCTPVPAADGMAAFAALLAGKGDGGAGAPRETHFEEEFSLEEGTYVVIVNWHQYLQ